MRNFLTYKYKIKGKRARALLREHAIVVNQVWNFCVATQKETRRRFFNGSNPQWLSDMDFCNLTKGISKELKTNSQTIQNTCNQFVISRDTFRRIPKFRASFGPKKSLGWVPFQKQSRQISGNSVIFCGAKYRVFGHKTRPIPDSAKGGQFIEDSSGQWWVCFQVKPAETHVTSGGSAVGIDLGLKSLATLSNGKTIENITPFKKMEKKLAVSQRSKNKKRTTAIVRKIKNIRQDYLHKASIKLVKENCFIAVGNVSVSKLAKTKFAKSVYDASWSTFRNMLRYKASRHGAIYLEVDESFTTQTCSSCGQLPPGRPKGIAGLGIRQWDCSLCGASHDRDVNAAKNILNVGLGVQPPVEERQIVNCIDTNLP